MYLMQSVGKPPKTHTLYTDIMEQLD